jgi:phospholipid/cholesterol/gamma-HCH transport system substrate-binding protein
MKKQTGNKLKLGIFVSVSIVLFIISIYFIGQRQQLFSRTFHIVAIFKNISGLQVGNNVRFSGINVGIIKNIEQITDSTVKVDMQVEESTRKFIKKNATAIIGSDGLMGNKIINIISGKLGSETIMDHDVIETNSPISMDEIMLKLKTTSDYTASITYDLSTISQSIRKGNGTIGKLFMDSIFAQNLDKTLYNTASFSSDISVFTKNISNGPLGQLLTEKAFAKNLDNTITNAKNVTEDFSVIAQSIRKGKGTLGKLYQDTAFSQNLDKALSNVNSLTKDVATISHHTTTANGALGKILMDTVFADNLDQTLINVKLGADNFNQNMEGLRHSFLLKRFFKKRQDKDSTMKK